MEERIVEFEQIRGWWGVEVGGGYTYKVHIHDSRPPQRFTFYEIFKGEGPDARQNILSGRFEFEVDALNLYGEELYSSWFDPELGTTCEERSRFEGDPIMIVHRNFGKGYNTVRVYMPGPFQHIRMEDDLERTLPGM